MNDIVENGLYADIDRLTKRIGELVDGATEVLE
jgi:hypothetical protein